MPVLYHVIIKGRRQQCLQRLKRLGVDNGNGCQVNTTRHRRIEHPLRNLQ
jgi:hypothetical protein